MWTIIIITVLFIIFDIISESEGNISLLGFIIGVFLSIMLPANMIEKTETYNLVCLQDNNTISGNFFIGSGTINGTSMYSFYYQSDIDPITNKPMYKRMNIETYRDISITYTDDSPRIVKYEWIKSDKFINHFAFDLAVPNDSYVFYIPDGSILNEYKLDAQ